MKEQDLRNKIEAVKHPSLALSIFPASSKKYDVVHCRDERRHPSGSPIQGIFSETPFFNFSSCSR